MVPLVKGASLAARDFATSALAVAIPIRTGFRHAESYLRHVSNIRFQKTCSIYFPGAKVNERDDDNDDVGEPSVPFQMSLSPKK